jgi:hypothetical protein
MKVDSYEVLSFPIREVIDKLAEADGALPSVRVDYLISAAKLLASAIAEIAEEISAKNQ